MGFIPSASFSLGIEVVVDEGGAKVGYLIEVSRRQEVMSIGEALVKSASQTMTPVNLPLSSELRPTTSLAKALALDTSFIPPRHASRVFHNRSSS
jgi:hypothetical protein